MSGQSVERQEEVGTMREYPLVPLKNVVVFPRTRVNLTIVRPRSVQAVMEADKGSRIFVAAKQRSSDTDDPQVDDINQVATVVQILSLQPQDNGGVQLVVEGLRRVQIEDWVGRDPYFRVVAMRIPEPSTTGPAALALVRHAHELFESYTQLNRRFSAQETESVASLRSPSRLADVLAASLVNDPEQQQDLLETFDPDQRLEKVCVILGNEIGVLELDKRIRERVRDQVDTNQKTYYLKEQLIAIQKELGQDIASETQELRDRVAAKGMPAEVEAKVLKEIGKLERMPANSAEVGVLRNYIDWTLSLPWQERTDDQINTDEVERVLNAEHYGLVRVKDRIVDFMAVRQLRATQAMRQQTEGDETEKRIAVAREVNRGPILCLIGPPGVGKTSLGESIAHAMGRKFVRISLGGVHDEAEIRGHRRTYVGALPGRIIHAMKTAGVKNPVFLLDEIDKMASDYRGDPAAALLEVLDPAQNHTFTDHYLEVPYDLSEVFFICTGNNRFGIPRPLADRMEIIDIPGYTEEEKVAIARNYIWPRVLREHALTSAQVRIPDKVVQYIIAGYTREAGVRSLERQMRTICSKVARRVIKEPDAHIRMTKKTVEDYLGVPRFSNDQANESDQVGVATGLAWTEHGGTLLPIEVAVVTGRGNVQLTGQQGEVMQESARAAHTYIRTRTEELGISTNFADQVDMHVHLPEGAIPKDGPSAGITMATAMISALTRRAVRADTAMTGEITLRGRVLAIGGLRDKVLAAHRAHINRIIMPAENKKDIGDIPDRVRAQMEFIFVANMEEVEKAALRTERQGIGPGSEEALGETSLLVARGRDSGNAGDNDDEADRPEPPNEDLPSSEPSGQSDEHPAPHFGRRRSAREK